jgi:hypothetical protein
MKNEKKDPEVIASMMLLIFLFIMFGVTPIMWMFFEYAVNPIARYLDGYTPYMPEKCWHFYMSATSTTEFEFRDNTLLPAYYAECKPERNYNPLQF